MMRSSFKGFSRASPRWRRAPTGASPNLAHRRRAGVLTVGGGARNEAWTQIRSRSLGVPVRMVVETETAYGTALLALHGGPPPGAGAP